MVLVVAHVSDIFHSRVTEGQAPVLSSFIWNPGSWLPRVSRVAVRDVMYPKSQLQAQKGEFGVTRYGVDKYLLSVHMPAKLPRTPLKRPASALGMHYDHLYFLRFPCSVLNEMDQPGISAPRFPSNHITSNLLIATRIH